MCGGSSVGNTANTASHEGQGTNLGNGEEEILLYGLPGDDPVWKFVNGKVVASALHNAFKVRRRLHATSPRRER